MISRRRLLIAAPATAAGIWVAAAQNEAPFKLDFGYIDLEPEFPVKVAADTSGYTTCQVRIYAMNGGVVVQSKEWGTEANRPNSLEAPAPKQGGEFRLMAEMRPTAPKKPSMSAVVSQDPGLDLKTLEAIADRVRFVKDPASIPSGGHFVLDMPLESRVQVQIFKGETRVGAPVYEKRSDSIGPGPAPIPWDLRMKGGGPAPAGRYFAYLICIPKDPRRKSTKLFSTFGVV